LQQAEFLNKLFDEKSFSWTAAMEELERVLPAGVQVTAIEPSRAKDGQLTLKMRISGQRERAVLTVRNMEHSQRFVSPRISGETSESNGGAGELTPVRDAGKVTFEVLAEYNPATLEERKKEIEAQKRERPAAAIPLRPIAPTMPSVRPQYVPPSALPMPRRVPQVVPQPGVPPMTPRTMQGPPGAQK